MTDEPDDDTDVRSRRGRASVALPAAMLVVGVLLGVVVTSIVGGDDDSADSGEGPSSIGPSTAVVVPDSCVEAAATVREATDAIRNGVDSVREFQPDDILALLDRLEDLDAEARRQAATCTGTQVTDAPATTPATTPASPASPEPTTASATPSE